MAAGSTSDNVRTAHSSAAAAQSAARRAAAALIALGWCAALAWLALATSNPITLNRKQIRDADAVVTVRVIDAKAGTCRIVQQWTGDPLPQEIVVDRLLETAARGDAEWILPLARHRGELSVLTSRLPSKARLVYPATPEAVRQLAAILGAKS